jgi:hypothetical protein
MLQTDGTLPALFCEPAVDIAPPLPVVSPPSPGAPPS